MIKRAIDLTLSLVGLLVLAPALVLIGVAIRITSPGPVFYRGTRVGRSGREFRIMKFRTMQVDAEQIGSSSTPDDDQRITRIGAILRRGKLDELPQLWNVVVGDMSMVGPRPQVRWAVERYTENECILLSVRPGITDPASLRFANEGEILRACADPDKAYFELIHPEKMRLSIDYVKNRTDLGDLAIILATLGAVCGWRSRGSVGSQKDTYTI